MAKQMSERNEQEFAELKAFLHFYSTQVRGIAEDNPVHPTLALEKIVAAYGKSKALAGLRQAINDTIEETQHYPQASVSALDRACTETGLVTLSELRRRYWSKYKSILTKQRIRNETEYYLVVGVLSDMATQLSATERQLLQQLVVTYEQKIA